MSNLQNTSRLPLRATMTTKWKSQAVANDLLESKTQALEGGLNKLKFNPQRDQPKSTIDTNRRNGNKEIPQNVRDKPTVNLSSTKSKSMIKCGQCEKVEAKKKCLECVENYCANCFSQFHLRGALQRHRCVSLSTSPNKNQSLTTDTNLRELSDKQSKDNLQRKSNIDETREVLNEKSSLVSFQQSFLQWRDNNINKSQRIKQKNGLISPIIDRIEYSNKLPYMESNSSNKYQHTNKTNQPNSDNTNLNKPMFDSEPLNDDLSTTITTKSIETITSGENSNNDNYLEPERPIPHVPIKSFSNPTNSSINKDPITSRPNSPILVQRSLRSLLTTKSTDELEAIIESQSIPSRSSSSISEQLKQPSNWQPLQSTSNSIDVQPIIIDQNTIPQVDLFDESKTESAYRLNYSSENISRVTPTKDQTPTHTFCMNSIMKTPRRNSPFSFSNSLNKLSRINSSSSLDTGEGGFFTEVIPRQIILSPIPTPPPAILECSSSNEWKYALENQSIEQDQTIPNLILLRKLSIKCLSRSSSKHSITRAKIHHRSQSLIDNNSRPGSSLSSSSLPVSITSSKGGFNNSKHQSSTASSRKNSSSSTSTVKYSSSSRPESSTSAKKTTKNSSSSAHESSTSATKTTENSSSSTTESSTSAAKTTETSSSSTSTLKSTIKNSSTQPEPIIPITPEVKKETSSCDPNASHQESMNSLKDESSSNVNMSESSNDLIEPNLKTFIIREENITENDLPAKKKTRRRVRRHTITSDESSTLRKLEFSMGDGLKWQEASIESMSLSRTESISSKQSSNVTTPRSLTPSNPINTKLADQFQVYDNDDGRSSLKHQNMNDDECFNQLCQEFCSELNMTGSDEDAILNDHIVKILRRVKIPFNEKDLIIIETKLRENETIHQPSSDNELLIHE